MKISLVTISFNQAAFLERALRSVIEQDYHDKEYIVVDPGSTDGSREIIERYRSRIDKIIFEPDNGAAEGLNKGFAHTTGEVLGFLNSDDVLLPGALSSAAEYLDKHPDVDVVSGHSIIVDADDNRIRASHSDRFSFLLYAYGEAVLMQASTFFRRRAFEISGGFNAENRSNWDGELFLDMALSGAKFALVNDFWSEYRVHQQSITGSRKLQAAYALHRKRMFEKIMHRQERMMDRVTALLLRAVKHARNPRGLRERILHGPVSGRYQ
jgi:glycosyltransferase involved in cell wall biosynthesis